MRYEPTLDSVSRHPLPAWFDNAKLGIFVHWGLYSVPGWAPLSGDLGDILVSGEWAKWFANNPYAEWYMNSLRIDGSPTQRYHREIFGAEHSYFDFARDFNQAAERWDPDSWASLFARVHARYAVLTTKHHDGFTLWPTRTPNPFIPGYFARRDLVGDFMAAIRGQGLTAALYYSGGLDWTFNDTVIQHIVDLQTGVPQMQAYIDYANEHWRELIDRYHTMILWNDIAYPAATDVNELFADYFNALPDGVVNNRFTQRFQLGADGNIVTDNFHDFETPEYASYPEIRTKKWESCRGIGASFGYNRNEGSAQHLTVEELVRSFVDIVSKNGNLLLNVGPMADGTIPEIQRERLLGLGEWLDVNGEAIFDTRPWVVADGATDGAIGVRFTQKDGDLYATLLATPASTSFEIKGLRCAPDTEIKLLGGPQSLAWRATDAGVAVTLPGPPSDSPAHALRVSPAPLYQA
ncbi:MAG: alpha-L-fucosidase [Caldilinea sp.]|nr:alpha-L-fucosidase [Caldilinea sp.]